MQLHVRFLLSLFLPLLFFVHAHFIYIIWYNYTYTLCPKNIPDIFDCNFKKIISNFNNF